MKNSDFVIFSEAWGATCNVLGFAPPNEAAMEIIFDDLMEYSIEQVLAALKNHRKTSQFMPKPADVINFIKNNDTTAAESWSLVEWSIMNFGPRAVCFEDTRIAITLNKMGGYCFLINHLTDQNDDFYRKEFIEIFDSVNPEHYPPEMKACLNGAEPVIAYVSFAKQPYAYRKTADVLNELAAGVIRLNPPADTTATITYESPGFKIDSGILERKKRELKELQKKCGDNWVLAALNMLKV